MSIPLPHTSLLERALDFIEQCYKENNWGDKDKRVAEIKDEIYTRGTYTHTYEELNYGAQMAWRNSNRCIGRLVWKSLKVMDCRSVQHPEEVKKAILDHLDYATNGGKIRSAITIFAPEIPHSPSLRFWNRQIIGYASYKEGEEIIGDPTHYQLTQKCQQLGWQGDGSEFDPLPVVFQWENDSPHWFNIPDKQLLSFPIEHPDWEFFNSLGLRWYAVPMISDMALEIGGIIYPAAPFNGWYMVTEIGTRDFGDTRRYNKIPKMIEAMGKNPKEKDPFLWDECLLHLNKAVYYSFKKNGVKIVDHHTASEQFMHFCRLEKESGREIMADWAWIVPPTSGSSMEVFHQEWNNEVKTPNFYYQNPIGRTDDPPEDAPSKAQCPFHLPAK
jgi:nitric-oxide synthase